MKPNRSIPASTIVPTLIYPDVREAVAWLRQYTAEDHAGHQWTFSETLADIAPETWGGTSVAPRG